MPKAALVDLSKCMGCRGCQVACKQWNGLTAVSTTNRGTYENPPELSANTWTRVEFHEGTQNWTFRKHQCMHCTDARCVAVCPTGSMHKEGEFTLNDEDVCIGCGRCVAACPFGVPHLSEAKEPKSRKCTFCVDRVLSGLTPACAKTCPPKAIQFGERDELLAVARARVQALASDGYPQARIFGETEEGGLNWLYVLPEPAFAPTMAKEPLFLTSAILDWWSGSVITAGMAAALPVWWLLKRRDEMANRERAQEERIETTG